MSRLNTCEKCGHYSWVHEEGKCQLDYCHCGKETDSAKTELPAQEVQAEHN